MLASARDSNSARAPGRVRPLPDRRRVSPRATSSTATAWSGDIAAERGAGPFDDHRRDRRRRRPADRAVAPAGCRHRRRLGAPPHALGATPTSLIGGSDAGRPSRPHARLALPHPVPGATRSAAGSSCRVERAVQLMTDIPARLFGLPDRGRVAAGCHADLVVFDPATVDAAPGRSVFDLPGGASGCSPIRSAWFGSWSTDRRPSRMASPSDLCPARSCEPGATRPTPTLGRRRESARNVNETKTVGLNEARQAIEAILAAAAATEGLPIVVTVADRDGEPIAFARMDGADYLPRSMATRKAYVSPGGDHHGIFTGFSGGQCLRVDGRPRSGRCHGVRGRCVRARRGAGSGCGGRTRHLTADRLRRWPSRAEVRRVPSAAA